MPVFPSARKTVRSSFLVLFVLVVAVTFMTKGVFAQSDGVATSTSIDTTDTASTTEATEDASSTATYLSATSTPEQSQTTSTANGTIWISCTTAYTSTLYDTPDGHLDATYTLGTSTSDTGLGIAHVVGTQSWADCTGTDGNTYEIKLSPDAYASLGEAGSAMPQEETLDLSATDIYSIESTTTPGTWISPGTSVTSSTPVVSPPLDTELPAVAPPTASSTITEATTTMATTTPDDIEPVNVATTTMDMSTTTPNTSATSSPN